VATLVVCWSIPFAWQQNREMPTCAAEKQPQQQQQQWQQESKQRTSKR